ncbi:MAG: PadR family transcriptional regulator [Bacillota bacterium]|nr:PadR family transcriptional regulator [Bacillota bacterium]
MNAQFKRGLLETCVLSVLSRKDSYGYQIIKDLSACVEISESTLYPILKRLESSGCLSSYSVEHNGRLRKFYHISPHGQERIEAFLENWKEVMLVYDFIREGTAR